MPPSILPSPRLFACLLVTVLLSGCGDGEDEFTANVAGSYSISVTNRESTCQMSDWMEGNMATGIPFEITQSGSNLEGTVGGLVGAYVTLVQGNPDFEGTVRGSDISLTNYGTRSVNQGNCTFTYNAVIDGSLLGDSLSGTITYSPATNSNPDCADIQCAAVQEFSGSRPPR